MGFIYKITNDINDKVYIGLTTRTLSKRWSEHKRASTKDAKTGLHNAIYKYGKEHFNIELVETCDNNILIEREQYWIQYFHSLTPNGYNLTTGGEHCCMFNSDEILSLWNDGYDRLEIAKIIGCTSDTISLALKNNGIPTQEIINRGYERFVKPVSQYDLDGNWLYTFPTLKDAQHFVGHTSDCGISAVCKGTQKQLSVINGVMVQVMLI